MNDFNELAKQIKSWGQALGFQQVAIADTDLILDEQRLQQWLQQKFHGEMAYMQRHGTKRTRPDENVPGTLRVISARMDYLPPKQNMQAVLEDGHKAYVSRYALGRDYHKVLRGRLNKLAQRISKVIQTHQYRAFVDSAPVLEKALAQKAGLGWMGKHTNLINRHAGSWFFLGELYTNLPLPIDKPTTAHCGTCTACLDICPTQAIIGPYQLDARRCISYLTIEYRGVIPLEFRPLLGNRIYGCDDCQLVCPWNRYAKPTQEKDFQPRHGLDDSQLLDLFSWNEQLFLQYTEGMAIRRIGYDCWQRNIAVALGNAPYQPKILSALKDKLSVCSALVAEHVQWAIEQQLQKSNRTYAE